HNFNIILADILRESEMESFLNSLLTKTERIMLAKRVAIAILLRESIPQTSISSSLNVTQATVSRMQLFLEARGEGYDIAFKKLANEKTFKEFKKLLIRIAGYSVRAASGYVKPEIL
ncbi:MAG: hypothetical protein HYV38_00190, partial [Candidatus Levybacteria bacterium]|nr:hypothetical protein [Candidatus Levybacteria bacterium]